MRRPAIDFGMSLFFMFAVGGLMIGWWNGTQSKRSADASIALAEVFGRAVDGNTAATQSSRLETSWSNHRLTTFRRGTISEWVREHCSEIDGCMAILDR